MAPLVEWWVGVYCLLCNVLKSRYTTQALLEMTKNSRKPGSNYGTLYTLHLNLLLQPLQPLPLTYEPVPRGDCRFHQVFFFLAQETSGVQTRVTLYSWTPPNVNQTERKLGQLQLVAGFIVL